MRKIMSIIMSMGLLLCISFIFVSCALVQNSTNKESLDEKETAIGMSGDKVDDKKVAPDFSFVDFEGQKVTLDHFAGEKVYIKYWASWCSICLAGLEDINTLSGEDHDFKIITVVTPDFKGEKSASEFKEWFSKLEEKNITVLFDENGEYAKQIGVRAYPTSIYIGSDKELISVAPGHTDNEQIIAKFNDIS